MVSTVLHGGHVHDEIHHPMTANLKKYGKSFEMDNVKYNTPYIADEDFR